MSIETSDWKRQSNAENAQRSTGPRTAVGKRRSRMNARSHGIFCHDLVLDGESRRLFLRLRETFIHSLAPQDTVELMLVDRIASATWRLRRLQSAESVMHAVVSRQMKKLLDAEVARLKAEVDDLIQGPPYNVPRPLPQEAEHARLRATAELFGDGDVDAAATLASSFNPRDDAFDRASRYEQRLQTMIHRSLQELRALRDAARKHGRPGPSPFGWRTGRSARRALFEPVSKPNCARSAETDPALTRGYGPDAEPILQNEPTAG